MDLLREGLVKTTRKLLGGRIKELRKLRKLSQEGLSEGVGIDPKHLSRIEVGRGFPSLDTLEKIAMVLKVEIKDFFEFNSKEANRKDLKETINKLLKETDEDRLRLLAKVIKAVVR